MKTCNICLKTKQLEEFPKAGKYLGEVTYRAECKECNRIKQKSPERRESERKYKTSQKGRETRSLRRKDPEVRAKERDYEKHAYHNGNRKKRIINRQTQRLAEDPVYRGIWYVKNRLRDWVKANGEKKNSEIGNYVGCTKDEFREHIAKQFKPGMTWENHGEWEYDHIKPISSAKTMEEAYKLTHYTNFQPLWKLDNRKKGAKIL